MFKVMMAACATGFVVVAGGAIAQAVTPGTAPVAAPAATVIAVATPQEIPGEATAMRVCSQCHSFASATQKNHTREEWNSLIGRMIEQGLVASDDELMEVSDYLTANHGSPAS